MSITENRTDKGSWGERFVAGFALHVMLLLVVTLVPVQIYEMVRTSAWHDVPGLDFAGGITYPLYIAYLISRLKSTRAKFILFHLLILLTLAWLGMGISIRSNSILMMVSLLLPSVIGAMPLPLAVIAYIRRNMHLVRTCLVSTLLSLPIGLALSMLVLYGMGRSSMSGMRW
jgi:hypothetical protein